MVGVELKGNSEKKLYVTYIEHTEIETNWELLQIKPIIRVTINHANKLYQVTVGLARSQSFI